MRRRSPRAEESVAPSAEDLEGAIGETAHDRDVERSTAEVIDDDLLLLTAPVAIATAARSAR